MLWLPFLLVGGAIVLSIAAYYWRSHSLARWQLFTFAGGVALSAFGLLALIAGIGPRLFDPSQGSVAWFKLHTEERNSKTANCAFAPTWVNKAEMNCANAERAERELQKEASDREFDSIRGGR